MANDPILSVDPSNASPQGNGKNHAGPRKTPDEYELIIKNLTEERDRLQAQVHELENTCKCYLKSLKALIPPIHIEVTEEDYLEAISQKTTLMDLIEELRDTEEK